MLSDAYLTQSAMGATSEPCCMRAPMVNQKELSRVYWFSYSSGSCRDRTIERYIDRQIDIQIGN